MSSNRWQNAFLSHPGKVRPNNEDSVLVRPEVGLWVVADGMGGHQAGDFASQSITQALARLEVSGPLAVRVDQVEASLLDVNCNLREHASKHCQGRTVGSTVVTMLALNDVGVVLWAGDSRLYRLRAGKVEVITRDHNPIADLLDEGVITESTALNSDSHIVTRAIGGHQRLMLDVAVFDVCAGDTFLLCTDGLYREVDEHVMSRTLRKNNLHTSAERLMGHCLAGAARDNVSFVVSRALA